MSDKDIRDTYAPIVYFDGLHLNTSPEICPKKITFAGVNPDKND